MNDKNIETIKAQCHQLFDFAKKIFDRLAVWVIQMGWGKFIFLMILLLIMGGAIEDGINGLRKEQYPVAPPVPPRVHTKEIPNSSEQDSAQIDADQQQINKKNAEQEDLKQAQADIKKADHDLEKLKNKVREKIAHLGLIEESDLSSDDKNELIDVLSNYVMSLDEELPPKPVIVTHISVSNWVFLFVMMLLGIKVFMGGKKRAEALAREAQKESEREALLRQVAEAKIQMMQAQIEPHFLFNTLASVEYLIETDPPRASAMQRSLIQYLRQVLPQIRDHATSNHLGREADMVAAYLELLKMRMEERLEFNIHIPEGLRSAAFPPMILQTLVENAIKHGLEPKTAGGSLSVYAEIAHQKLRISVIDNGLGFGMAKSSGTGLGLQNIRERLALLYKGNSLFSITENTPSGVCITIEVPYTLAA
jgi:signal transduction histidine kinase